MSDETSEYDHILNFDGDQLSIRFNLLSIAMMDDGWEFLDLEAVERELKEFICRVKLCKRYNAINRSHNDLIKIKQDGFEVDGHVFQTLDEVEVALKNKAFL